MWLSKRERAARPVSAVNGVVTSDGESLSVLADLERRGPTVAAPYGFASSPPQGEKVVMLADSGVCLGSVNRAEGLRPGEVRLFSAGGAQILLRADGAVVINGQVFEKTEGSDGDRG